MAMNLSGKRVLITGGGTGVGRSVAHAFAAEGCKVGVTGRREDKLCETVESASSGEILTHVADVGSRDDVTKLFAWANDALGPVDILVNSAGMNIRKRMMADIDPAEWDRVLSVNATGAFNTIHAALPAMRAQKDGLIVNISSVAGKRAVLLGGVAYNASKFAMTALGTSVGLEEAENGIRVTNIYPGEIDTPILDERPVKVSDEHKAKILKPEDIAAAVIMVAKLPPTANVPEMVIKPTSQAYA